MKIKKIFKIVIAIGFLQILPLMLSIFSTDFKLQLTSDVFGSAPSEETLMMFDHFALCMTALFLGLMFHMIGSLSFDDEYTLRRLSFLYFVFFGFICLTDLIAVLLGSSIAAPAPVILLGLVALGLLYYGYKKGIA